MIPNDRQVCPACGFAFEPRTDDRGTTSPAPPSILDSEEMSVYSPATWAAGAEPRVAPDPVLLALGNPERESASGSTEFSRRDVEKSTGSIDFLRLGLRDSPEAAPGAARSTEAGAGVELDDVEASEDGRSRLVLPLLASYASAATLALVWFVVLPKIRGGSRSEEGPVVSAKWDAGLHAGKSRRVEPPPPVAAEHRTSLGRPLTLGSLEITPLEVARRSIVLVRNRVTGDLERREESERPLILKLRLRNTSGDQIFAPFDPSFVRERENGMTDSFTEHGSNLRVYPFPLAPESEWSIEGQSFRELKPGEALETVLVLGSEGGEIEAEQLFWRVRLRVGIDRTHVVGVTTHVPR